MLLTSKYFNLHFCINLLKVCRFKSSSSASIFLKQRNWELWRNVFPVNIRLLKTSRHCYVNLICTVNLCVSGWTEDCDEMTSDELWVCVCVFSSTTKHTDSLLCFIYFCACFFNLVCCWFSQMEMQTHACSLSPILWFPFQFLSVRLWAFSTIRCEGSCIIF